MIRCSEPQFYRGFTIRFDAQIGVTFSDGSLHPAGGPNEWAARSWRHARERIDDILTERDLRASGMSTSDIVAYWKARRA